MKNLILLIVLVFFFSCKKDMLQHPQQVPYQSDTITAFVKYQKQNIDGYYSIPNKRDGGLYPKSDTTADFPMLTELKDYRYTNTFIFSVNNVNHCTGNYEINIYKNRNLVITKSGNDSTYINYTY